MIQKKERKKGRVKEGKEKKTEKAQMREKVRLMAWVSKDRDNPFQFFEEVLPHINVSMET